MEKFDLGKYNNYVEDFTKYDKLTPKKAIMAKCKECCGYSVKEAKLCESKSCPLFMFNVRFYKKTKKSEICKNTPLYSEVFQAN